MVRTTESGLRALLLVAVAVGGLGTVGELIFAEHWQELVQGVPFVLSAVGSSAALACLLAPSRATVLAARVAMLALIVGAAIGTWEHVETNYAFEAEIHPTSTTAQRLGTALFGASPLLAPGMLAWFGLLGLGATWRHPAMLPPDRPLPV